MLVLVCVDLARFI